MPAEKNSIHIAAALIDNGRGEVLLVRKAGTRSFMQAGGKIEAGEDAFTALQRELIEEIGLEISADQASYLGRFSAEAANEAMTEVVADLFHIRTEHCPVASAEIAQAMWVTIGEALELQLAPLTRDAVLPLAMTV